MANIKQQIKRNIQNEKARLRNASYKSSMKTAIKNVIVLAEKKDPEVQNAYSLACKKLDKALAKGIVHKNYVARNKSRLALLVNQSLNK